MPSAGRSAWIRCGHVWDLAGLGWALHGSAATTTVPIGEFTSSDSGAVVVWDSDAAGRLFGASLPTHRCRRTYSTRASPDSPANFCDPPRPGVTGVTPVRKR